MKIRLHVFLSRSFGAVMMADPPICIVDYAGAVLLRRGHSLHDHAPPPIVLPRALLHDQHLLAAPVVAASISRCNISLQFFQKPSAEPVLDRETLVDDTESRHGPPKVQWQFGATLKSSLSGVIP